MKVNTKRSRLLSLLLCLIMILGAFPVSVFAEEQLPEMNAKIEGDILNWEPIEGAYKYKYTLNNNIMINGVVSDGAKSVFGYLDNTETSIDLVERCRFFKMVNWPSTEVTICAVNENKEEISTVWKGTYNYTQAQYLSQVTNVQLNGNVLSWDAVDNAEEYCVKLDALDASVVTRFTVNTSMDLTNVLFSGTHTYHISIVPQADYYVSPTEYTLFSQTLTAAKPDIQNLKLNGDFLTWDPFEGAGIYYYDIISDATGEEIWSGKQSETSIDLALYCYNNGAADGTYTVHLSAYDMSKEYWGASQLSAEMTVSYNYDSTIKRPVSLEFFNRGTAPTLIYEPGTWFNTSNLKLKVNYLDNTASLTYCENNQVLDGSKADMIPGKKTVTVIYTQNGRTVSCIIDIHVHDWDSKWTHDMEHHWHECNTTSNVACNRTTNSSKNGYGAHADSDGDGCCDVCGYMQIDSVSVSTNAQAQIPVVGQTNSESGYRNPVNVTVTSPAGIVRSNKGSNYWYYTDADSGKTLYTYGNTDAFAASDQYYYHLSFCTANALPATITVTVDGKTYTDVATEKSASDGLYYFTIDHGPYTAKAAGSHIHQWTTGNSTYVYNNTHHWHECEAAGCTVTDNSLKSGYAAHVFEARNTANALKSAATCTEAKVYYYSCVCGAIDTSRTFSYGDAEGHKAGDTWYSNGSQHWHICSVCGIIMESTVEDHYGGSATCSAKKICYVCDVAYGDYGAHSFTKNVQKDEALKSPAVHLQNAVYYKSCEYCGAVSSNESDTFTAAGTAPGHTAGSEWLYDANQHWHICSADGCDYKFADSVENHHGGTATCTEKAVCIDCGQSYGDVISHVYTDNNDVTCNACGFTRCILRVTTEIESRIPIVGRSSNEALFAVYKTVQGLPSGFSTSSTFCDWYSLSESGTKTVYYSWQNIPFVEGEYYYMLGLATETAELVSYPTTVFLDGKEYTVTPTFDGTWYKLYIDLGPYTASHSVTVSGTATSFGSDTDDVTIQLIKSGASEASYETVVKGNSASYSIKGVAPGTYTMKVMKNKNITREYTVTVSSDNVTQNVYLCLLGDVNDDGLLNTADYSMIKAYAMGDATFDDVQKSAADLTHDGAVDAYDAICLDLYINDLIEL